MHKAHVRVIEGRRADGAAGAEAHLRCAVLGNKVDREATSATGVSQVNLGIGGSERMSSSASAGRRRKLPPKIRQEIRAVQFVVLV